MASGATFNQDCRHEFIEVTKLIDLTDQPIRLTRDEISSSKVRSTSSNCICCCSNNSITLVTTKDSYIIDHIPLENVKFGETNPGLSYLAISNHRKLVIIELVDSSISDQGENQTSRSNRPKSEIKMVNLPEFGLTMNDVVHWRWIDDETLAILTVESLYTCAIHQAQISHPAYTALSDRSRLISLEKVCDVHYNLTKMSQIIDIQCDSTKSLYLVSGLYSAEITQGHTTANNTANHLHTNDAINQRRLDIYNSSSSKPKLRPSFGSMPSRLSQLVYSDQSSDASKSGNSLDVRRSQLSLQQNDGPLEGYVQIYCKMRDRTQLIQAHTATFTRKFGPVDDTEKTLLIAATKLGSRVRLYFIEMATPDNTIPSSGQNWSPLTSFDSLGGQDFPTGIVCSHLSQDDGNLLPVAMMTTKHGQLYVFSIMHGTKLFHTRITNEVISSAILERETNGLMAICRSGQVLLIKLLHTIVNKLLLEKRKLIRNDLSSSQIASMDAIAECQSENDKHISSDDDPIDDNNSSVRRQPSLTNSADSNSSLSNNDNKSSSLDTGLEVLISTRL